MTVERIVRIVAGSFILLSLSLAHFTGKVDMTELSVLWFTAFVGANLLQSGLTRLCPLNGVLKKFGVKEGCCG